MTVRAIHLSFERVGPNFLRMIVSHTDGPIIDIAEVDPRSEAAYSPLLACIDLIGGQKAFTVSANFPLDLGRVTAAKAICKRAVAAAIEWVKYEP